MEKSIRCVRCWGCKSFDSIKWGKQQGKHRYRCKSCGLLFILANSGVKRSNEFIWFEKWVLTRQTISSLSLQSGYSERTLKSKFHGYLERYPTWKLRANKVVNLVLDGTYFANKICLFIYRDNELKDTLLYRVTDGEHVWEIYEDLLNLMRLGVIIESITCDGHKSILRSIKDANKWIKGHNRKEHTNIKPIVVQRCLVHIQRSCLTYLKKEHHSPAGRRLRHISMTICKLDSFEKRDMFISALDYWLEDNRDYVTEFSNSGSRRWRTHKALYSAYKAIKSALPNMFHYLDNPKIPHTTNCIEGYFAHLKGDISIHRGLSHSHFKSFLRWYVYLKSKK